MKTLKLRIINQNNGHISYDQQDIYRQIYNYNCNPVSFNIGNLYKWEQLTGIDESGKEVYEEIEILKPHDI